MPRRVRWDIVHTAARPCPNPTPRYPATSSTYSTLFIISLHDLYLYCSIAQPRGLLNLTVRTCRHAPTLTTLFTDIPSLQHSSQRTPCHPNLLMPAVLPDYVVDAKFAIRGSAKSNSTAAAVSPADAADPQPSVIHFSTLTLILIGVSVFLVLAIVAVLVILARRRCKIRKQAISKPERRDSARTLVAPFSSADLKALPGLPDPPSFAGRFSYYNASGGVVSLKDVIVEDIPEKRRDFGTTSRDRAWLLDQSAISPAALTFPPTHDASFSDGLSDYYKPRSADPLRGSDMPSYYFDSVTTSPALPSVPSPVYSPVDPLGSFQMKGPNAGRHTSASEFSLSAYGEPPTRTATLQVHPRYNLPWHRVSDTPPRLPTLLGLDAFSNIGTAMMEPASPSIAATPIPTQQPMLKPPTTPKMSSFGKDTLRSHFSPPTPILSPIREEPRRGSNFSFSRFYGSYGPATPQVRRGAIPRSETAGERFKHRRFSSELDARFAVGLGLDFSRRAGYI
ncbi:hypothetical protein CALVIDRAFT_542602 [Calocera viscosa TUFC12733]|uniref:Uncharacterized protein n=1 Tax=Calocera viscosa (strain TUFC12733) TaxID=1330018 RepID=A0A167GEV7_CALVF|nr:hypothetical protein CALVIDRAFT_542602 [Calocera viscosa TUFC12733]